MNRDKTLNSQLVNQRSKNSMFKLLIGCLLVGLYMLQNLALNHVVTKFSRNKTH